MSDREAFVDRWSRRKAAARQGASGEGQGRSAGVGTADLETQPQSPEGASVAGRADDGTPATEPRLPDIESLGRDSDFTAFMREGVPEGLRKQALRKLWRLDPAFSKLDGLLEYGEDYNAPKRRPAVVRTAWRIGRGMAPEELHEAAAEEAGEESSTELAGSAAEAGADEDAGKGSA